MFAPEFVLDKETIKAITDKKKSAGLGAFPFSFYNEFLRFPRDIPNMGPECVDDWKDAGFTFGQTPRFEIDDAESVEAIRKILLRAEELGIKVILTPAFDRWATEEVIRRDYPVLVEKVYAAFNDISSVYGMFAVDEPGSAERHKLAIEMVNIQKKLAPKWTPFLNLLPYWEPGGLDICWLQQGFDCFSANLDDFAKGTGLDYLSYDLYAPMKPGTQGFTNHFNCLRYYREASLRNKIPFRNILLTVGHFNYRHPDYNALRWQMMTSIACGSSAIGWYYLYQGVHCINYRNAPIDEMWHKNQGYYDLRKLQRDFAKTYGDIFNNLVCYRTEFVNQSFGSDPAFCPNDIIAGIETDIPHHPLLIGYFTDIADKKYVMIVNNTPEEAGSVKIRVTFHGDEGVQPMSCDNGEFARYGYICNNELLIGGNKVYEYWLAPGQEVLIRVDSERATNAKAIIPPMVR